MSKKIKIGCGASKESMIEDKHVEVKEATIKEESQQMIKVGKPAPNFTAQAFHNGDFTKVSLEDYKGKWVLLCFYPGDFTFV